MLIKFKKIRHILPIIFLGIAVFAILIFFGLSQVKAINITGSWLQTDSSATETGFNFTGNTKTQTGIRGTGFGAGVGTGYNFQAIAAGGNYSFGLLNAGTVKDWGRNSY